MTELEQIQQHWDDRAALGVTAGTQDLILKELEQRAILAAIPRGMTSALEIGCGTGELAKRIATEHRLNGTVLAVDQSPSMIAVAREGLYPRSRLQFRVRDVQHLPEELFSVVVTERMLINLPTWELQHEALKAIADRLNPGGRYLMCEHSQEGLDAINETRAALGLSVIKPPPNSATTRNRYLVDRELQIVSCLRLLDVQCFSATYYFLSRIVNAYLAQQAGTEPAYDAPVNRLAVLLNQAMVANRYAQGRLYIWEKP